MEIGNIQQTNRQPVVIVLDGEPSKDLSGSVAEPAAENARAEEALSSQLPKPGQITSEMNRYFDSVRENHKITVSIGYVASGDMARIYAASSAGAVRGVIFSVNANMKRMQHSGASADQVDEVVRKMKRVLGKAQNKLFALKREAALENRRRMAEIMQKRKAAELLTERLRKKRYVRRAREYCEILDAGDILHAPSQQYALPGTGVAVEAPLPLGATAAAPVAAAIGTGAAAGMSLGGAAGGMSVGGMSAGVSPAAAGGFSIVV